MKIQNLLKNTLYFARCQGKKQKKLKKLKKREFLPKNPQKQGVFG
jgi:hypothetical protein